MILLIEPDASRVCMGGPGKSTVRANLDIRDITGYKKNTCVITGRLRKFKKRTSSTYLSAKSGIIIRSKCCLPFHFSPESRPSSPSVAATSVRENFYMPREEVSVFGNPPGIPPLRLTRCMPEASHLADLPVARGKALHKNTSWALIERPYSCAPEAVGAVYDRPGFFVQSPKRKAVGTCDENV